MELGTNADDRPGFESNQVGIRLGLLLLRSPLGALVRWVASVPASLHTKFLIASLAVAVLFISTAVIALETVRSVAEQSRLLNSLHERVDLSRQIEQVLAMQMNFTAMALNLRTETAITRILRENNRFNNMLAEIERNAPVGESALIERIRLAQDRLLVTVADIANLLRDGNFEQAMKLHLEDGQVIFSEIDALVRQIVKLEADEMTRVERNVHAAHEQALLLIGVFAGTASVLTLVLAYVISWSIILPMREAGFFLGKVSQGDFDATIDIPNNDEFGALARRMNKMSQDLRRLDEAQSEASKKLRGLNRDLELANKAKSEFLANMSHELRTPLNAVIGFSEVLKERMFGDLNEKQAEYADDIHSSGHHLLSLINDILDLSKIEAGHVELDSAPFDLGAACAASITLVRERAMRNGLTLECDVDPALGEMVGEERKFKQILLNLLSNAIKFTDSGGRVRLSARVDDDKVFVEVSDTGIGIAEEDQGTIFEEFRQLDSGYQRSAEGTGLGLSLTRRFVEMHGGTISVSSEPGKGSTFTFWLPAGERAAQAVEPQTAR